MRKMLRISNLIIAFNFSCIFSAVLFADEGPAGPVSREIVLDTDLMVEYGQSASSTFSVSSGLTPPLHHCSRAQLQGIAKNSQENFKISSNKAKLSINLDCLKCDDGRGHITTRKITGVVSGSELNGEHYREMFDDGDRFGLGLDKNSKGTANISSIDIEISDCWLDVRAQ